MLGLPAKWGASAVDLKAQRCATNNFLGDAQTKHKFLIFLIKIFISCDAMILVWGIKVLGVLKNKWL